MCFHTNTFYLTVMTALFCLHPAAGTRAQLNSLSYWLSCSAAPPTVGRPETQQNKSQKKNKLKLM